MIDQASRHHHERLPWVCALPGLLLGLLLASVSPVVAQTAAGTAAEASAPGSELSADEEPRELASRLTTDQWRGELRESASRFLQARAAHRRTFDPGIEEAQRQTLLDTAISLDTEFAAPHLTQAREKVLSADVEAGLSIADWATRLIRGYRQQSRLAANVYLTLNILLAGLLAWVMVSLILRYLPFFHHQVKARFDRHGHTKQRHLLLWVPVLLPPFLGLGLVPSLALLLPLIWMYTQRRARVVLGILVGWFAVQGVVSDPFGALLIPLDSQSTTMLSLRSSQDPPTRTLFDDLDAALRERPEDASLYAARGLALARAGRFEDSTAALVRSLELEPEDPRVMNNIACNHFYLGNVDRAVSGYQQASSQDPTLGAVHHNMSQAYIRKLFFKEGGEATQRALQAGFSVERRPEPLPRGAVYYEPVSTAQLWSMAWNERDRVAPHHLLQPIVRWLGTPVDHAGAWLLASLVLSILLGRFVHRSRLVFECANCAELACGVCHGEHEGAILCLACAANAKRARSEIVLRTLLRNRRHEAEGRYAKRIRGLSGLCFGLGHIYDGVQARGLRRGFVLVGLVLLALHPHPLVPDVWNPVPETFWSGLRILALLGLVVLALVNWFGRFPVRSRALHLHPSNLVSLVDLMEGRPRRKANA